MYFVCLLIMYIISNVFNSKKKKNIFDSLHSIKNKAISLDHNYVAWISPPYSVEGLGSVGPAELGLDLELPPGAVGQVVLPQLLLPLPLCQRSTF
jgi:hypothetical protein